MKTSFPMTFIKTSRLEGVDPIDIAKLAIELDCASITIDGKELPDESIQYAVGYGIRQLLADSYANPQLTRDKARDSFDAKLTNLLEGAYEYKDGENGRSGDPVRVEMRNIATLAVLNGKSRAAWIKANGENAEKSLNAKVAKVMEANADKLRARAMAVVAERKLELDLDLGDDNEIAAPVLIKSKRKAA